MSFALVAVILLLLAGASVAAMSQLDTAKNESAANRESFQSMVNKAMTEGEALQQAAFSIAMKICSEARYSNETLISSAFQEAWKEYLNQSYPATASLFEIEISNSTVGLRFLRLTFSERELIAGVDQVEAVQSQQTIPAYFSLKGQVRLRVVEGLNNIIWNAKMDLPIYVPAPLLANRMEAFVTDFSGAKNDFENVVRYMLQSFVQARMLNGYGSEMISKVDTPVLSERDVSNAVSLAILLEERKDFRSFDEATALKVLERMTTTDSSGCLVDLGDLGGDIDPADLFLQFNQESYVDMKSVLAQTLYAMSDTIVLRWLDYMQIADILKFISQQELNAQLSLIGVLDAVLQKDTIKDNAVAWISGRMTNGGVEESRYRYMNQGRPDTIIDIPTLHISLENDEGERFAVSLGGSREIDFPSYDIFNSSEWKNFAIDYRARTFDLAATLSDFVVIIAQGVANSISLPEMKVDLNPADGRNYLDQIVEIINSTVEGTWFTEALEKAQKICNLQDAMGKAFLSFVDQRWPNIFDFNDSVGYAIDKLGGELADEVLAGLPGFGPSSRAMALKVIDCWLRGSEEWGVRKLIEADLRGDVEYVMNLFRTGFSTPDPKAKPDVLAATIIKLASGAIQNLPGLQDLLIWHMRSMVKEQSEGMRIRGDRVEIPIADRSDYTLHVTNSRIIKETLQIKTEMPWLEGISDALRIAITDPSDYNPKDEVYPNQHTTDIGNLTMSPFRCQFGVRVQGSFSIELAIASELTSGISTRGFTSNVVVPIDFNITLFGESGWPLAGISYRPTMTLLKQMDQVFGQIWNGISGVLQWVGDILGKVFSFLQDILSSIVSFGMKVVNYISDLISQLVQALRDMLDGALSAFFERLSSALTSTLGKLQFNVSLFGLLVTFETDLNDITYGKTRDLLKVTIRNGGLSLGLRFLSVYRKGYDLMVVGGFQGEDWAASCTIDPRMMVISHFLELTGDFDGFSLEICSPKIVQYTAIRYAMSDVPAIRTFLSSIPTPIPGLTASLDIGFEAKFNSLIQNHVVINEVEPNPRGTDDGREWVELYNPSNHPVDLAGWSIETSHGVQMLNEIGNIIIEPKGHYVVSFHNLALDNGGEQGIPLGEQIILIDQSNTLVDSTQYISDHYNDDRTWQRAFDGAERWVFKEGTRGVVNGALLIDQNDPERLVHLIQNEATKAFGKHDWGVDINSLGSMIQEAIEGMIVTLIEILARSVVEMGLFIELKLTDCSQSFGGGFRLSLMITGDFVRDAFLWLVNSIKCALGNIMNPTQVASMSPTIDTLLDDVYVRFAGFGRAGLPKLVTSAIDAPQVQFSGMVEVNLATLIPSAQGGWDMRFGILFERVPGRFVSAYCKVDADKLVDIWLLSARLHSGHPDDTRPAFDW